MICQYTSTFEDFKAAQKLARRHHPQNAVSYYLWFWVVPALGCLTLCLLVIGNGGRHIEIVDKFGAALAGFTSGSIYLGIYRPFWVRRCYKRLKGDRPEDATIELEVTANEIISRLPGRSEGRFFPTVVIDYVEDDKVALVYISKKQFLFVPKRAMSDSDWIEFRVWIHEKTRVRGSC